MRVLLFPVLALLLAAVGCTSSGPKRLETATAGVEEYQTLLRSGGPQIDAVVMALEGLETNPDKATAYKTYRKEVHALESLANKVRARRVSMKSRIEDHIANWSKELQAIQSETVREASLDRKDELAEALEELGESMDELKEEFMPFMSQLKDIELLLANDLSTGGIEAAGRYIRKAKGMAEDVKEQAGDTEEEMGEAIKSFVGKVPAPAPAS